MVEKTVYQPGVSEEQCDMALGMNDGVIEDYQITASSYRYNYDPHNARLNGSSGWSGGYQSSSHNYWIQVNLLLTSKITQLDIQGSSRQGWTKEFRVLYSPDGYRWRFYMGKSGDKPMEFTGNTDSSSIVSHNFTPPIEAQVIAIQPISWHYSYPSLRFELYGCSSNLTFKPFFVNSALIEKNSYWTISNSPYIVNQSLLIPHGKVLNIQAGVEVVFTDPDAGIVIEGQLIAEGIESLAVSFSSDKVNGQLNADTYWKGLQFNNGGTSMSLLDTISVSGAETCVKTYANQVKVINSVVFHCYDGITLEKGKQQENMLANTHIYDFKHQGITLKNVEGNISLTGVHVSNEKHLSRDWCFFFNTQDTGLDVKILIENSSFIRCYYAMNFYMRTGTFDVTLNNLVINGSYYYGLMFDLNYNTDLNLKILKSNFTDISGGYALEMTSYGSRNVFLNVLINECQFENVYRGIYLNFYYQYNQGNTTISNNIFQTVSCSFLKLLLNEKSLVRFDGNLISNSTCSCSKFGEIDIQNYDSSSSQECVIEVFGNKFTNNSITTDSGVIFFITGLNAERLDIKNNYFFNNSAQSMILTKLNTSCIVYNVFDNPNSKFEIQFEVPIENNDFYLNATMNWWGTTNSSTIRERIFDFFHNVNYMIAELSPILTSPIPSEEEFAEYSTMYSDLQEEGILGGIISNTENLISDASNCTVVSYSLFVSSEVTCTITGPQCFWFKEGRGILVEGLLQIQGEGDNIVVLEQDLSNKGRKWGGLHFKNSSENCIVMGCNITGALIGIKATGYLPNITNTVVSNCGVGLEASIETSKDSVLYNSSFLSNDGIGVSITVEEPTSEINICLSHSVIIQNSKGLSLDVSSSANIQFVVEHSKIINNTDLGFSVAIPRGLFLLTDSVLEISHEYVYGAILGKITSEQDNNFSSAIKNTTFLMRNGYYSYFLRMISKTKSQDFCDWLIENCTFVSMPGTYRRIYSFLSFEGTNSYQNVTLINNTFLGLTNHAIFFGDASVGGVTKIEDNFIDGSETAIYISFNTYYFQNYGHEIIIQHNYFTNLSKPKAILITNTNSYYFFKTFVTFSYNALVNNSADPLLYLENINVTLGPCNLFNSNEADYLVEVGPYFQNFREIDAIGNWWGSPNFVDFYPRINDNRYDPSKPKVTLLPFLKSENCTEISSEQSNYFFFDETTIGGEIIENITVLDNKEEPYSVLVSIVIPENKTLIIKPGVTLEFHQGTSLYINGTLQAIGEEDSHIILQNKADDSFWFGLKFNEANGGNSSLEYVDIYNASTALDIQGIPPVLNYFTVTRIRDTGLKARNINGSISLSHCMISLCERNGIEIDTEYDINIYNCTVRETKFNAMIIHSRMCASVIISDANFMDCGYGVTVQFVPGIFLLYNSIFRNVQSYRSNPLNVYLEDYTYTCAYRDLPFTEYPYEEYERPQVYKRDVSNNDLQIYDSEEINEAVFYHQRKKRASLFDDDYLTAEQSVGVVIKNCVFEQNNYPVSLQNNFYSYYTDIEIPNLKVVLTNCTFHENSNDALKVTMYTSRNSPQVILEISHNVFTENRGTTVYLDAHFESSSKINIKQNVFSGNSKKETWRNSNSESVLRMEFSDAETLVERNTFLENRELTLVLLAHKKGNMDIHSNVSIVSNILENNNFSSEGTSLLLSSFDVPSLVITKNVFDNPMADCEVKSSSVEDLVFISAQYNYWGVNSEVELLERVCDFHKNVTRSLLLLWPALAVRPLDGNVSTQLLTGETTKVSFCGGLGGVLNQNIHVLMEDSPCLLNYSILVNYSSEVLLDHGVELLFEKGRGIFLLGSLISRGTENFPVIMKNMFSGSWGGVFVGESEMNNPILLQHFSIENAHTGLTHISNKTLEIRNVNFCFCECGAILKQGNLTIHSSVFFNMTQNAVSLLGGDTFLMENCQINISKNNGLHVKSSINDVEIRNCSFDSTEDSAIVFVSAPKYSFVIEDNLFQNIRSNFALDLKLTPMTSLEKILISANLFRNNSKCISIQFYGWYTNSLYISLEENSFQKNHGKAIFLQTRGRSYEIVIQRNNFSQNEILDQELVSLEMLNYNYDAPSVVLAQNDFEENKAQSIILLGGDCTNNIYFDVFGNRFINNQVPTTGEVIESKVPCSNINFNIFNNPQALYYLKVEFTEDDILNATYNYWGTQDEININSKILDNKDSSLLGSVLVIPYLKTSEISCDLQNNCSGHGECVKINVCICESGWKGDDCSSPTCKDIQDCYGKGTCIGPNLCSCQNGWLEPHCWLPSCFERNNCSNHGVCVAPNVCYCSSEFTGEDCSACASNRWGSDCHYCPNCEHGLCNLTSGQCECDIGWTGSLCDFCAEQFYGSQCDPLMKVIEVAPASGPDVGGNLVYVKGHNLSPAAYYTCMFGETPVNGSLKSSEEVVCAAPNHQEGKVLVQIGPEGTNFTSDNVEYYFHASCPEDSCGQNFHPPRGHCAFGHCQCVLPWYGQNCQILRLPTKIARISDQVADEQTQFSLQLFLTEGSTPVIWKLKNGPKGMKLQSESGLLSWDATIARERSYEITVSASNDVGSDIYTLNLHVPLAYTAVLNYVDPGPYQHSIPIYLSGTVEFSNSSHERFDTVPVNILVQTNGYTQTMSTSTIPGSGGKFYKWFYSPSTYVGLFLADAKHPNNPGFTEQIRWSVYGLWSTPSVTLKDYLGNKTYMYEDIVTVTNTGIDLLSNVTVQFEAPDVLDNFYIVLENGSPCFSLSCFLVSSLNDGEAVNVTFMIGVSIPVRGMIPLNFMTSENVASTSQIFITYTSRKPQLEVSPSEIRDKVARTTSRTYEVHVSNVGLASATNVKVVLPVGSVLNVVSFGSASPTTSLGDTNFTIKLLPREAEAVLTLSLFLSETYELGKTEGSLQLSCQENVYVTLPFSITVVSSNKVDLAVSVEDEYTFFAEGKPLVNNSQVKIWGHLSGHQQEMFTNESGVVIFQAVPEDYYTISAKAHKHSPESIVQLINPGNNNVIMFLKRTTVTYTFSVRPIQIEDKYEITLEADFETYVPAPVVTVEPSSLDLESLERGYYSIINFEVTNHGLIRADNVTFGIPEPGSHPFLIFDTATREIGQIEANTTIIITVRVHKQTSENSTQLARSQRGAGAGIALGFAFGLLYCYFCRTLLCKNIPIPVIRPPQISCHCSIRPHFWGPYIGPWALDGPSIDLIRPVPSTSLVCDALGCVASVATCIMAFFDVTGCPSSIYSLVTANSLLQFVVGVAGTIFSCLPISKVISNIISGIGCLVGAAGVYTDCIKPVISGRRKREITKSDVVPTLIERAQAASNLLDSAILVFGSQEWLYVRDSVWFENVLFPSVEDRSDGGNYITEPEYQAILSAPLPQNASYNMIEVFLHRWNNTVHGWGSGVLEGEDMIPYTNISKIQKKIKQYQDVANEEGFSTIFAWYDDAVELYQSAPENKGVCAKVRIKIQQELVLTREAFEATLEIENGDTSELRDILVVLRITSANSNENATEHFAIGDPDLKGILSVDGDGILDPDATGTALWLIIPYPTAAPSEDDVLYDVGGTLYYRVGNGSLIEAPLLPDTVTVKPDPQLFVHYFWEKEVISDDPFTTVVEPAIPFSLGVMISNTGYGPARNLHITSAQPEIIENEKGLLINFQIIGAQLGNQDIIPSLTVNFKDIGPGETKTARWLMTASLKGEFSNYSAVFQNNNPLGDPKLSLINEVTVHELIHVVCLDFPFDNDDEVMDFLVNDIEDVRNLPDAIYSSAGGVVNASRSNSVEILDLQNLGGKVTAQVVISSESIGWTFSRKSIDISADLKVSELLRSDGRNIRAEWNVWLNKDSENTYLNILDYYEQPAVNMSYGYTLILSSPNRFDPEFQLEEYKFYILENVTVGTLVGFVKANDSDTGQSVTYNIVETDSTLPFTIDETSGAISTMQDFDRETKAVYDLTVKAMDSGEPQRWAVTAVRISIEDVNDNFPRPSEVNYIFQVEEAAPFGYEVGRIMASDPDEGIYGLLTFKMESQGMFVINESSGSLQVNSSLSSLQGEYSLNVSVSDGGGKTALIPVIIQVFKQNIYPPVFNKDVYVFSVPEDTQVGTEIGRLLASDKDPNSIISYKWVDGSRLDEVFSLNTSCGCLVLVTPVDYETKTFYSGMVKAIDNGVSPTGPFFSVVNIEINIVDINDNSPLLNSRSISLSIPEDTPIGTTIQTFFVSDSDSGPNGMIGWFNLTEGSSVFSLFQTSNSTNFSVVLSSNLDREELPEYNITVVVEDQGTPPLATAVTWLIVIEDVNDNPPVFPFDIESVIIFSSLPVNSEIYTIMAEDPDQGALEYGLNTSSQFFSINTETGVVEIEGELEYSFHSSRQLFSINPETGVVRLHQPLENNTLQQVNVTVSACDGIFCSNMILQVIISENNTHSPEFSQNLYNTTVPYSIKVNSIVMHVSATDRDSYDVIYKITAGNKGGKFRIDSTSGIVQVNKPLTDGPSWYQLVITAYDGEGLDQLSSNATLIVEVIGKIQHYPQFTQSEYTGHVFENASVGTSVSVMISANDEDEDEINYFIEDGIVEFKINHSSGDLEVAVDNLTVLSTYRFTIFVKEKENPERLDTAYVNVEVLDMNDHAPEFENSSYVWTVSLSSLQNNPRIGQVIATDEDYGQNANISYRLIEDLPEIMELKYFYINSSSGEITLNTMPQLTKTTNFSFMVEATDQGNPPLTSLTEVRVEIVVVFVSKCHQFEPPANSYLYSECNILVGTVCLIWCEIGYTLHGSNHSICLEDGTWSRIGICKLDVVNLKFCAPLQPPDNGYVVGQCCNDVGSVCTVECDPAYILIGSQNLICQEDESWAGNVTCIRANISEIQCIELNAPSNGFINGSCDNNVGSDCRFACEEGFILNGSEERTCQEDSSWSGNETLCIPQPTKLVTCTPLSLPTNGVIIGNCENVVGFSCVIGCKEGYILEGNNNRTCQNDTTWSGEQPQCIFTSVHCPVLRPPRKGWFVGSHCNRLVGSVCFAHCQIGYQLVGSREKVCLPNGQWSGGRPECKPIQCESLEPPDGGQIINRCIPESGNICQFKCNRGYVMIGSNTRVCLADGQWAGEAPTCQEIRCPVISLQPGVLTVGNCSNSIGSRCFFSCPVGYRQRGSSLRTCLSTGMWSGTRIRCLITCLMPPNSRFIGRCDRIQGSVCRLACRFGYTVQGSSTRICLPNGQWSGPQPVCTETI
ncbi:uncharacterized protein LOC143229050 isoform X1 [Tachypleus tridentatus]|uniref:uncharacterized protein LOC143229050 isoform X1 n=1 Tax=Tachypleus tridentatus TaxID=6853 RepID=UPI003FD6009D